jgi:hypothetical protein
MLMKEQDSGGYSPTGSEISGTIEAGQTKTFETSLTAETVGEQRFRLAGTDNTASVAVTPMRLDYGENYVTPENVSIEVTGIDLETAYETEGYDGSRLVEPEGGQQFAFVNVRSQNQGLVPEGAPSSGEFKLIADGQEYDMETILYNEPSRREMYSGGELQPESEAQGSMASTLPSSMSESDVDVVWSSDDVFSPADKSVRWSSG